MLPVPAHSPVGFLSKWVGVLWPEEAGPGEGTGGCEEASYQHLGVLLLCQNSSVPHQEVLSSEYTRDGKMSVLETQIPNYGPDTSL